MEYATYEQGIEHIKKYLKEQNIDFKLDLGNRTYILIESTGGIFSVSEHFEASYLQLLTSEISFDEVFCFYIPEDYEKFKTVMDILFLPYNIEENGE